MAKITIAEGHDKSTTKLNAKLSYKSEADITVGKAYDCSVREINISEYDSVAISEELQNLQKLLSESSAIHSNNKKVMIACEEANNIARNAQNILDKRKWYSISIEGLVKAAKVAGETMSPIVSTAMKLLELLNKIKS